MPRLVNYKVQHGNLDFLESAKPEVMSDGITPMGALLLSRFMEAVRLGLLYSSRSCDSLEFLSMSSTN